MRIKSIKEAFRVIHKDTPPNLREDQKSTVRSLVISLSKGNVNLQLGRFSSRRDIDKRRESICKYKFVD